MLQMLYFPINTAMAPRFFITRDILPQLSVGAESVSLGICGVSSVKRMSKRQPTIAPITLPQISPVTGEMVPKKPIPLITLAKSPKIIPLAAPKAVKEYAYCDIWASSVLAMLTETSLPLNLLQRVSAVDFAFSSLSKKAIIFFKTEYNPFPYYIIR